MPLIIQPMDTQQIEPLVNLASVIWHKHYDSIIGDKQVDYMLEKFQSEKAIQSQILEGYQYYVAIEDSNLVGYCSIKFKDNQSLFISKFYLSDQVRGKGYGRSMLNFIQNLALETGTKSLDLTVNKFNPAYEIYLKLGFKNVGSAQFDIGEGYIMDDYLLKKML